MEEYHKIETLIVRDTGTHKVTWPGDFRTPAFEYLAENTWLWSEKVDGTNVRIVWDGEKVEFKGRTDRAQMPMTLVARLTELFGDTNLWKSKFDCPVTLYGEGYGARIQKGGGNYKSNGVDFVLFDVYIGMWLERENVQDIAKHFAIQTVPLVGHGPLSMAIQWTKQGFSSEWGDFAAEGLVVRPQCELHDRRGCRVIGKIKTKDF